MVDESPEPVERWTAKRRAALAARALTRLLSALARGLPAAKLGVCPS